MEQTVCHLQQTLVSMAKKAIIENALTWYVSKPRTESVILQLRNRKRTVFLSSYRNTSGSLGEREMLWEHEPQASVSTTSSSSPKLSGVFL